MWIFLYVGAVLQVIPGEKLIQRVKCLYWAARIDHPSTPGVSVLCELRIGSGKTILFAELADSRCSRPFDFAH